MSQGRLDEPRMSQLQLVGTVRTKAVCQPQPPSRLGKKTVPRAPALGNQSSILYSQVAPVCAAGTVSTCRKKSSFQILQVNKQTAPTGYENKVANRLDHSGFHRTAVLGHLQAEGPPPPRAEGGPPSTLHHSGMSIMSVRE